MQISHRWLDINSVMPYLDDMDSIANDWIEDIIAELHEIGMDDLIPTDRSEHALAMLAAYVVDRDDAFARGLRREWLVEGPGAPRLGIACGTLVRAQRRADRLGEGHTIRPGYGNRYGWRSIDATALVLTAQRVAA